MTQAILNPAALPVSGIRATDSRPRPSTTVPRPPVKSSGDSTPAKCVTLRSQLSDAFGAADDQRPEFDPRGWAVHLKMLAKRGMLVRVALAEVQKELRTSASKPSGKLNVLRAKKAGGVVVGGCK